MKYVDQMKAKVMEDASDMAFKTLGVGLLLLLPRNALSPFYWIAVGSWVVIDLTSDNSNLEKLADLV